MTRSQKAEDTVHAERRTTRANHNATHPQQRTKPMLPRRKETPCQATKTNQPAKANPAGIERVGRQGRAAKRYRRARGGRRGERSPHPPPRHTHPTAAHGATARRQQGPPQRHTGPPERRCVPAPAQQHPRARSARHKQTRQGTHAAPHTSAHHGTKHNTSTANTRPTTTKPPRTSPSPAVPTAQQPPSGWTCVHPAVNPAPAGYKTAAVRTDVCAPGSEPSPCRLRNSCRPDGRVCARQ